MQLAFDVQENPFGFLQMPAPSQYWPLVLHDPSVVIAGTLVHVPAEPATLHDLHVVEQAVVQHTPS
jgi:hypothetical protein